MPWPEPIADPLSVWGRHANSFDYHADISWPNTPGVDGPGLLAYDDDAQELSWSGPGDRLQSYVPFTNSGVIDWLTLPLAVDRGGTGRASHTAYAVLCGGTGTTAMQQSVSGLGSSGQVLTSNGAGALPSWQTPGGGGGGGGIGAWTVVFTAADYTASAGEAVLVDCSAGGRTVTLPPAAAGNVGKMVWVKSYVTTANALTIDGDGAETINGLASLVISGEIAYLLICDGSNWHVVSGFG